MKKIMATVGVILIGSSALAQTPPQKTPVGAPKKETHGKIVSTAAHQDYEEPGKGKIISLIARLKHKKSGSASKGKSKTTIVSKSHQKSNPNKRISKVSKSNKPTRPVRQQAFALRTGSPNGSARVNRPKPARRPAGAGRFNHIGRG